jgi:hypothetical protein
MQSSIVCGVDGSPDSHAALAVATELGGVFARSERRRSTAAITCARDRTRLAHCPSGTRV